MNINGYNPYKKGFDMLAAGGIITRPVELLVGPPWSGKETA